MNSKSFFIIGMVASFVVASMLNVYPLSPIFASMRPMFLAMVLIFWVMYRSTMLGVWSVFLVGLVSDLLFGTHLGHQAFCAVVMAFAVRVALLYTKELNLMQAWLIASIGLSIYQVTLWTLQAFSYHGFTWLGIGSLISSVALFPAVWLPLYWINQQLKERAY